MIVRFRSAPGGRGCGGRGRGVDSGSVGIEFVATIPLALMCAMFALQVGAMGWTAVSTSEAAREAARASSLGEDVRAAAEDSLPGTLTVERLNTFGPGHGVTLTVKVPRLVPGLNWQLDRTAVLP